ncbi:MAG: gliding motility-associated C-terminal domain-containing protein, partial [Salibacteraceae bacterium]
AQKTVYVTVNPNPIITPYPVYIIGNPILCPGDVATLQGSGAPNYEWFGPGVFGMTDSIVSISSPGNYTVKSTTSDTNQYGCIGTYRVSNTIQINNKVQPTISASPLVICPGATVDITSSSFSGNEWEGPNGPIIGAGTITVSDPGDYFTVVNDADSCGLVSNTVTIQQYATPTLVAYGDTTICPGATTIIGVQSSPGSTISWNPPLMGSSPVQAVSNPGVYTCSIVSCGITTQASITIHLGNPLAIINPTGVLCKDSSVVLQGPAGMASYSWLPNNDSTQNITVDSVGTYTLTIVDANGCAGTSLPFSVSEFEPNTALTNSVFGFCYGDSITLQADTSLTSYLWTPNGETTSSITVFDSGSYALRVVDSNGCVAQGNPFFVSQSDVKVEVLVNGDSLFCEGDTAWLNVVNMGYSSYNWTPGNINSSTISVTNSGSFVLTAQDSVGCFVVSDTFNFSVLDVPIGSISGVGVLCKDSFLVLNGNPGMSSYNWVPGNETTSNITVTNSGNYTLVVTDSAGCESAPASFLVNEVVVPVAITNSVLGFCEGDSLWLNANSNMASYLWMPSGDTTQSLLMTESGTVTLSVVDSNGCKAFLAGVSVSKSTSSASIDANFNSQICEGDSVVITASNMGFSSYNWMPGNIDSTSLVVYSSGSYYFVSTDSLGCFSYSDTATISVIENNLVAPTLFYDSVVCLGDDVLLIADAGNNDIYWFEFIGDNPIHVGDSLLREIYSQTQLYVQTISEPCTSNYSMVNIIPENCDDEPDVSNVFTPNGDGVNDGWSMEILGAKCYEVEIYNRWGMLIYTLQTNGQKWNGKVEKSGMDAPEGTYYYILNYCDYKDVQFTKTGYITLLR